MNTKTKVVLSFILIFLVGFASGYLVKSTFSLRTHPAFEQERGGEGRWQGPGDMSQAERMERGRNRLARRLDLSDEQQRLFFPAMKTYTDELRETIRQNRMSEHEYVLQRYREFRDEISETLNSEQLQRMDSVLHPDSVRSNRPDFQRGRN
tara:strand:- start:34294 stop:34746 length:453 start_codon:yes stop_codon:yes gene_type:complete